MEETIDGSSSGPEKHAESNIEHGSKNVRHGSNSVQGQKVDNLHMEGAGRESSHMNTVQWDFLQEAMRMLEFPEKFTRWIMECVTTPSFSISLNGQLHGYFVGKRGLRQGDPLSPYLFSICLEMLSRSLKNAASSPDFNYHPKCEPLGITHLAYADDLLLLSRGDTGSLGILVKCLNDFSDMAGLRANVLKSNIYIAGVSNEEKENLLRLSGFQLGTFPFRYLGIPLATSRLRISDYSPLLDKLSSKINSWPRNSLSHAGRLELIRSVLQGVLCYWMSILPVPEGVIGKIYSLCRTFFWSSKHPSVSWKKICRPIEGGGLGLRNLKAWNKALLSKVLWNIHEKKDTMWVRWVNHFYFNDFWRWKPKREDSPLLKSLVSIRDELKNGMGTMDEVMAQMRSWFDGKNKIFKGYNWFHPNPMIWPWKPLIWKPSCILPKHRISFWIFAHKKFLTKDRQPYIPDKVCVICNQDPETFDHLFFQCHITRELWNRVREWVGLEKRMGSANALLKAFRGCYRGNSGISKTRLAATATTIYSIWNARNRKLFDNEDINMDAELKKIQISVFRTCHGAMDMLGR